MTPDMRNHISGVIFLLQRNLQKGQKNKVKKGNIKKILK